MAGDLNVNQLTVATTVVDADKLYYGKSPFGVTDDRAISYLNFKTQINITDTYSGLNTTDKTIVGALNEAYQWVSDGFALSPYTIVPRNVADVVNLPTTTASSLIGVNASKDIVTITALPNGTTATTQAASDNSTKVATTAYVDAAVLVENLWDRADLGGANWVLYPSTAGDKVRLPYIAPTTGAMLFADTDGNKTISASSYLFWTGAGLINASAAPYFKAVLSTADGESGIVWENNGNTSSNIFHVNHVGNSTLYIDAKTDTTGASIINFGANTTASSIDFIFTGGKASYAAHPTFSADTELVDKKYVDEAILGEDLWDRVSIDGGLFKITPKDSTDMLDIPKSIHSASTLVIQGHISSNYIAQFNALSGNAQIGLRQSASTPNVKIGHIYQRYTADNWFVGLNTTNEDFLFIRDPSGSAGISLSLNATTGAATFLSNIVTTSGNIYIGTPSDNTVGSWAQLKTGTGLSTTYKIQHYEDVSGDGSAYGYVSKFVVDYSGNAAIYATDGGPLYGTLTVGTVSLIKKNADPHLLIYATAGKSVIHIDQHSATRAYSGIKYSRNGTENWFAGLNTADDHYRIWRGGLNAFALQTNGTLHLNASVASSFGGLTILNSGSSGYPSITLWNGSVGATNSWNIICFDGKLQFQYFNGSSWINKEIWNPS